MFHLQCKSAVSLNLMPLLLQSAFHINPFSSCLFGCQWCWLDPSPGSAICQQSDHTSHPARQCKTSAKVQQFDMTEHSFMTRRVIVTDVYDHKMTKKIIICTTFYVHPYLLKLDCISIKVIPPCSSSVDSFQIYEDSESQIQKGKTIKTSSCASLFDDCTVGNDCASLIVDRDQR